MRPSNAGPIYSHYFIALLPGCNLQHDTRHLPRRHSWQPCKAVTDSSTYAPLLVEPQRDHGCMPNCSCFSLQS